jgi:hypothetical protein
MSKVTFEEVTRIVVKLDGKVIGEIKEVPMPNYTQRIGYQYFPKGSKTGGEVFAFKADCMNSLKD